MFDVFDNVKKLRDMTGIGIVDCKNALLVNNNNIDDAVIYLKKKGMLNAVTKSSRLANEGLIHTILSNDKKSGVILELRCETDFVSRAKEFKDYCDDVCNYFISDNFSNNNFLLKENDIILDQKLMDAKIDLVSRFKENIFIKKVCRISTKDGFLFTYVHFGRIGVILNISVDDVIIGTDVLMQITSMNPKYVDIKNVSDDVVLKEKDIYFNRFKSQHHDKDEALLNKMVDGQLSKFFKDNVLLEQTFVKDMKKNIRSFLNNRVCVYDFIRFELGDS